MKIEIDNSKIKEYREREETWGLLHLKAKNRENVYSKIIENRDRV